MLLRALLPYAFLALLAPYPAYGAKKTEFIWASDMTAKEKEVYEANRDHRATESMEDYKQFNKLRAFDVNKNMEEVVDDEKKPKIVYFDRKFEMKTLLYPIHQYFLQ